MFGNRTFAAEESKGDYAQLAVVKDRQTRQINLDCKTRKALAL